jgi:hypothetical protein
MKCREPGVPPVPRLAVSARPPVLAEQADDLRVSFDAIRHAYEGNRMVEHPNEREAQRFTVKGDRASEITDAKRHLSNAERLDGDPTCVRYVYSLQTFSPRVNPK